VKKAMNVECPCELLDKKICRKVADLWFLLPQVSWSGLWQISTSSINTIIDCNSGIDHTRSIYGRVAMKPMKLRRIPKDMTPGGIAVTKHTLVLEAPGKPDEVRGYLEASGARALVMALVQTPRGAELVATAELKGLPPPATDEQPAEVDNEPPADFDRETGEYFQPPDSDAPVYETEARAAPDDTPPRPATCLDCNGKLAPKDYDDSQEVREALDIPESEGLCRKCRARRLVPAD